MKWNRLKWYLCNLSSSQSHGPFLAIWPVLVASILQVLSQGKAIGSPKDFMPCLLVNQHVQLPTETPSFVSKTCKFGGEIFTFLGWTFMCRVRTPALSLVSVASAASASPSSWCSAFTEQRWNFNQKNTWWCVKTMTVPPTKMRAI